jgi:lipopolysaccharide/colanic/teichoic acid biosynthesis glycosyltransferase
MLKRAFDLIGSLLALIVLSPVFLITAILIKLDSPGSVLYMAERIGKDGETFEMYKFRTMVADAVRLGPAITYNADPRITRVGRFLRRTHIDEWPQFFNILRGDMSFVGPRPEAPICVEYYTPQQREVLKARPGMTGLAQVQYMQNEAAMLDATTLDEVYLNEILPKKLELDLQYIQSQSILLDLKLLIQTLFINLIERSSDDD